MAGKKKGVSVGKKTTKKRPSTRKATPSGKDKALKIWCLRLTFGFIVLASLGMFYIDWMVQQRFDGKRWSLPAKIYARPLELYSGLSLSANALEAELVRMRYRHDPAVKEPGSYRRNGNRVHFYTHDFQFLDGLEQQRKVVVSFAGVGSRAEVNTIRHLPTGNQLTETLDLLRLEPMIIGGFYPSHKEDRALIQINDVPPLLIETLITVEDRAYFEHHGIAWSSIVRAMLVNIQAGKIKQGGSTLTQQLVKNFYLTDKRSYWRKAMEAVMAMLLELHYDKAEILEAYLNEIYLGQNGDKGIHGLGLASSYYFGRSPQQLKLNQIALLVGIIKGPSYYDPRRHPKRATKRRNQVLAILKEQGVITERAYKKALKQPLNIARKPRSNTPYPAYMDLVKRQLRRDYNDKDLRNEGLRIFTSLDPALQETAEAAMQKRVKQLEKSYKMPAESLQSAVVITSAGGGEVLGLIGGRDVRLPGFNRALDALRPIGSLLKPAIYLTALENYRHYHWGSLIEDAPIEIEAEEGSLWTPQNYDRKSHGQVTMLEALTRSYNQAAARLGMELGLPQVLETVRRLGVERDLPAYPAVLLGGTGLTPIEVASMYQTIAAGGFNTPLRAIREVLDADGKPLSRYPFTVGQRFEPQAIALLTEGLKTVMREGTGRSAYSILPDDLDVAGKTGTTNGLRDSWFAGYSEDYLAIVWMGRDDNAKTPMTGSSGALRVWADIMSELGAHSLEPYQGDDINQVWYDPVAGLRTGRHCQGAVKISMHLSSIPEQWTSCGQGDKLINRIKGFFR